MIWVSNKISFYTEEHNLFFNKVSVQIDLENGDITVIPLLLKL